MASNTFSFLCSLGIMIGIGLYLCPLPFYFWELRILKGFEREHKAIITSQSDFNRKMAQEYERVGLFTKYLSTLVVASKRVYVCRMFAITGATLHLGGVIAMRLYPTTEISLGMQLALLGMSITYFIVIVIYLEIIGRRYLPGIQADLTEMKLRRKRAL